MSAVRVAWCPEQSPAGLPARRTGNNAPKRVRGGVIIRTEAVSQGSEIRVPQTRRPLREILPRGRSLPEDVWERRHRGIVLLLLVHAVAVPVFAFMRGYPALHSLLEAAILPIAAAAATSPHFSRRVRTVVASLGLMSASAILVHFSGGVIEVHFHFFVMVAVIALYQDWLPFLGSIGYVLLHHGVLGVLQPDAVFNHAGGQANPWLWAGIHAFFVAGSSAACLVTWRLNESLYASEIEAKEAAETARSRLALLAEAGDVLSSTLEVEVVLNDLAHVVVPKVADTCTVYLLDDEGDLRVVAASIIDQVALPTANLKEFPVPTGPADPVSAAIRTGSATLIERLSDQDLIEMVGDPEHLELVRAVAPTSAIIVPLKGRDRAFGALVAGTVESSGRQMSTDDVSLIEQLGHRAAMALENAQLYAEQRTAAETLQQSLLPERLPDVPGVESAARYRAGGPGVEIGGDWYDVLELPDGTLGLVMGDIVGRGVTAAALMGQIRNGLRALALEGHSPAAVLTMLNRMLHVTGPTNAMATVVYCRFDPETGTLTVSNAGHPPPLILGVGAEPTYFEGGLGMPLGAWGRTTYHEAITTLVPGATIVLYTDGLVEDRGESLDEGLERLRSALEHVPGDVDEVCAAALTTGLADRDVQDDIAVLAMRAIPLGNRVAFRLPARPAMLHALRATLRRWLVAVGATEDEAFEILVACGEACTNAIQHGRFGVADFSFEAEVADDVCVRVRSTGSWREPRQTEGGRGLTIMNDLMDAVVVEQDGDEVEVTMRRRLHAYTRSNRS